MAVDKRDFEERYSACFVDFAVKTGAGVLIGSMMGSFFLRGYRKWPMYIGGGLGFGMAYTNCEKSLNSFLLSMEPKVCVIKFSGLNKVGDNIALGSAEFQSVAVLQNATSPHIFLFTETNLQPFVLRKQP